MPRVQIIDNVGRQMGAVLAETISDSIDMRMAVAFVSRRGLEVVMPALHEAMAKRVPVEILAGLDMRTTEPEALTDLFELSRNSESLALYCYASLSDAGIYHPKMYLSMTSDSVVSIIGSSNLTAGGLGKNVEVNVLVETDAQAEIVSEVYETYGRLKFHPDRVVPDDEYVSRYAELCGRARRQQRDFERDSANRQLIREFAQKAKALRRPTATRRDLVGWLELVYDSLPDGEFANNDVYQHEAEFQQRFPENRNIRAKVRQQLQVLNAMGFVEHLGTGRWRKL